MVNLSSQSSQWDLPCLSVWLAGWLAGWLLRIVSVLGEGQVLIVPLWLKREGFRSFT